MSYIFRRFNPESDALSSFDCGNSDLNDFLHESSSQSPNATLYEREHLSVTYIVEDKLSGKVMAYFSLLNDKIDRDASNPTLWNRLSRQIPNAKRRSSYPALKIGRLAVCKDKQGCGLGRDILTFLQVWFFLHAPSGCRFLTVDALRDAVAFYQKNDFSQLVAPDPEDETVLMFFDLKGISRT